MPIVALIPLLSAIAPAIVKWIAGDDAGKVAQQVTTVVQNVLGQTDDPRAAFNALPPDKQVELRLALAKIEADSEAARRQSELDALKTELTDMQSARARDVEIRKTGATNARANVLVGGAYFTMLGCIGAIAASALKNWSLTGEVIAMFSVLITGCIAILKDCAAFEFGSSRSSRDKDTILAGLAKNGH